MSAQTAPCDWPLVFPCSTPENSGVCEHLENLEPSGREAIEGAATEYLWNWTGRRFGLCEVTLRPCRSDCSEGRSTFWGAFGTGSGVVGTVGGTPWQPVLIRGEWINIGCGVCGDDCSCSSVSSLRLPGPVDSVVSVVIDGETVPASGYRVDDYRFLVRQDGGIWPTCQNLSLMLGAEGTWAVTYNRGVPVPQGGRIAAGEYACHLARALCRDTSCGLPQRVQQVVRQGVTTVMLDSFEDVDRGHTGLYLVDSWVASVTRQPQSMMVYSPDRRRQVRGRIRTS